MKPLQGIGFYCINLPKDTPVAINMKPLRGFYVPQTYLMSKLLKPLIF